MAFFVERVSFVLILLLGLSGLARAETSVPLSFSGIDTVLNPFKTLIVENVPAIGGSSNSERCTTEGILDGFISFSKLYKSRDFPREDVEDFYAVPLMVFVSVLILVVWILITLCSCCFRCCFRGTKCCNPVLYAPKNRRKGWEATCVIVYIIALACFIAAAVLCITTFTSTPEVGTHMSENMVSPLNKYVRNIPRRFSYVMNNLDTAVEGASEAVFGKINLLGVISSLVKYVTTRFDQEVDLFGSLGEIIQGQEYEDIITGVKKLIEEIESLDTNLSNFSENQDIINAISEISGQISQYSDTLNDYAYPNIIDTFVDMIKNAFGIESGETNSVSIRESSGENSDDLSLSNILSSIIGIDEMLNSLISCLLTEQDDKNTCISNGLNDNIHLENISSIVTDLVMSLTGLGEEDSETEGLFNIESMEETITTYTEMIGNILELVDTVLLGNFTPVLDIVFPREDIEETEMNPESFADSSTYDESEETSILGQLDMRSIAETALPIFLPIICCVIALIMAVYILPVSASLCLARKAKKKGGCQCRGCVKCSTCCFSCGTPIIMIIVSVLGFALAVIYIIVLALLFNSDESNFGYDGYNEGAPIGEDFSFCLTGGLLKKEYILNEYLFGASNSEETETNAELGMEIARKDQDSQESWSDTLIKNVIKEASSYLINHINEILSCENPENVSEFDPDKIVIVSDDYDDRDIIKSHGTFASSINIKAIILDPVKNQIDPELFMNLFGYSNSGCTEGDAVVCFLDGNIRSLIEDGTIRDAVSGGFSSFSALASQLETYEETLSEVFKIFYINDGSDAQRYEESKQLNCDNQMLNPFVSLAGDMKEIPGIDNKLKSDFEKLSNCSSDAHSEITLTNYNIYGLFDEMCKFLNDNEPSLHNDCVNILRLMETINSSTEKMKPIADKLFVDFGKVSTNINSVINDYVNLYKNTISVYQGTEVVNSAIGFVGDTLDVVGNELSTLSNSVLGGALSCYPLSATKNGLTGMANDVSANYTKFTISLLVLAIGCLIMIVTANLGPMVYNEKYESNCCRSSNKKKLKDMSFSESYYSGSYSDSSHSYSSSSSKKKKSKKSTKHTEKEPTIIVLSSENSALKDAKIVRGRGGKNVKEIFSSVSETNSRNPQYSSPISIYLASDYTSINAQGEPFVPTYHYHDVHSSSKVHPKDRHYSNRK